MQFLQHNRGKRSKRCGVVAIEIVMSLAITFTFAMTMYYIGKEGCFRLYQFISAMVGSPVW